MIYLDNAATTFPKPEEVYQAVDYTQRNMAVNVGRGSYKVASDAMKVVDETRYLMADLLGVENPNNVVFTPSATIAANQIIMGLEWDEYKTVYVTPFEHNAIARPLHLMKERYNFEIVLLPFDPHTQEFNREEAEKLFSQNPPDYVFVNHISNVTGMIVPIDAITELAKQHDAIVVVDASQSAGLEPLNMKKSNIDYVVFAGHKNLYASWGIGGFVSASAARLTTALAGGTGSDSLNLNMASDSPVGFEVGSANIIAISSLNASLKWLKTTGMSAIADKKAQLMKHLIQGLREIGVKLYLPTHHTSVLSFNVDGYSANEVGTILSEEYDVAVRTGYHCAPYIHDLIGSREYGGTVRVSVGYFNTEEDINLLLDGIRSL
ncbi:MAG: aminotransferase class V-fold PLP-dependent enzyme [Clostridia bacterium]|nr:aminotransferase class V-fold PLP-dependent enzyme [Clostridia bacterium]